MRSPRQRVAAVLLSMRMPSAACASSQVIRVIRLSTADHLERAAIRMQETPAADGSGLDRDLPLVHQAVMQTAQGHEIGELRFAALGPVLDVMRIDVALVRIFRRRAHRHSMCDEVPSMRGSQKLLLYTVIVLRQLPSHAPNVLISPLST
jgi:hypothetical protein